MTVEVDIHPTLRDRIAVKSPYRYKDLVKSIPGARWNKDDGEWSLPVSWAACLALRAQFPYELQIGPELAVWAKDYKNSVIWPATYWREQMDAPGDPRLYGYQRSGVAYLRTIRRGFLFDEMGCLAGDTVVTINRGGGARKYNLSDAVERFNNGKWDRSIPTKIGRHENGVVRLATVKNMWCSGSKITYTVTTSTGREIRATDEHPFETPGGWKRLDELRVGEQVLVNLGKSDKGRTKIYYAQTFSMGNHPHRAWWAKKHWAVPTHRLVAEATLNGLDMKVYLDKIRSGETSALEFVDPKTHVVHHRDHNSFNNDTDNLVILTHEEHKKLHAEEGTTNSVLDQVGAEIVVSIELFGEELTYDIEVEDDPHNFLANGFVVHNTGKTVQSATALREMSLTGELADGPILIVCPNTMKGTWKRELAVWWPEVTAHIIQGSAIQRGKVFDRVKVDVDSGKRVAIIINWESLRSHSRLVHFGSTSLRECKECGGEDTVKPSLCEKHPRELNAYEFSAVLADECHRALDPHSKQTRALRAASGEYGNVRIGLTGTPISDSPEQFWTILNWVDEREWPTKSNWMDRMVDYTHNVFGGREINGLNPLTVDEFHATVDYKFRRVLKEVALPFLPPIVRERREVEMAPKQRKQYLDMRDTLVAQLDSGMLVAANSMVQVGRLSQLASSCGDLSTVAVADIDEETGIQKVDESGNPLFKYQEYLDLIDPSCKLDAFMDDLPDFDGQSVVVFSWSRKLVEMLSERLTKKKIEHGLITGRITEDARDRVIVDFQAGKFRFVLCTIQAGGTGITLTKASTMVFLQRMWSPVDMSQAYARAHRIGSEIHDSVTIIDYITPGTIEDDQLEVLAAKGERLEEIVQDQEQLRRLLKGEWAEAYAEPVMI